MSVESSGENPTVGYCRVCGKALDASTVRNAQGTIFCADHMPSEPPPPEAPGAAAPGSEAGPPPGTGGAGAGPGAGAAESPYNPYAGSGSGYITPPPPVPNPDVSPGVAFVLGMIPGVGAIYNGQYAKGFVHLLVLGLLITAVDSSSNSMTPIFGLMIPGFWFYMAFEAMHTARRRRLGQPVDEFSSLIPSQANTRFPLMPVLLIALGVVFLLDNLRIFEIRTLMRYWPVMLIALGIYMLVGRMKEPPGNRPPPSADPGRYGNPGTFEEHYDR